MIKARDTLQRARFFLDEAQKIGSTNRNSFQHHLESAIVFARSVTFHLQKEFKSNDKFNNWYEDAQKKMSQNQLCKFFIDKRNYILKEGPLQIERTIIIRVNEVVEWSDFSFIIFFRSSAFYRKFKKTIDNLSVFRVFRKQKKEKRFKAISSTKVDRLYFDHHEYKNSHALEVFGEYLDFLEKLLVDWETCLDDD